MRSKHLTTAVIAGLALLAGCQEPERPQTAFRMPMVEGLDPEAARAIISVDLPEAGYQQRRLFAKFADIDKLIFGATGYQMADQNRVLTASQLAAGQRSVSFPMLKSGRVQFTVEARDASGRQIGYAQSAKDVVSVELVADAATLQPNAGLAPDGTNSAVSLRESATTGMHRAFKSAAYVGGEEVSFSVAAKANGRNFLRIGSDTNSDGCVIFDLRNGAFVKGGPEGFARESKSLGNGWYLVSVLLRVATGKVGVATVRDDLSYSYLGNGTSGVLLHNPTVSGEVTLAKNTTRDVALTLQLAPEISYPRPAAAGVSVTIIDGVPVVGIPTPTPTPTATPTPLPTPTPTPIPTPTPTPTP